MSDAGDPPEIDAGAGQEIAGLSRTASDTASGRSRLRRVEERIFTEQGLRFYGTGVVVGLIITAILCWARPIGH